MLTPRTTPAGTTEFGRSRKTGYVTVGEGQDKDEQFAEARVRRKNTSEETLKLYFKSLKVSRGETESKFVAEKIKVSYSI